MRLKMGFKVKLSKKNDFAKALVRYFLIYAEELDICATRQTNILIFRRKTRLWLGALIKLSSKRKFPIVGTSSERLRSACDVTRPNEMTFGHIQ